nr:DUF262 domain-containing protein [Oceanimonas sp. MB9]
MVSKVQSVYNLLSRVEHNEISTPSYQRGSSIWTNDTKSRLIESLLVRIPIPVFYIDASEENDWKIVDGLQRISALKEFVIDKKLVLSGLEYITELNGSYFDDLSRTFQRRILETDVTVLFINPGTPEEVKYNIFKRINTGGLPLSDQEIRHALNNGKNGKATKCLEKIVIELDFPSLWSSKADANERMELNELVLRGLGSWFVENDDVYYSDIDRYLTESMKAINLAGEELIEVKVEDFSNAYKTAINIFDDLVFRKIKLKEDGGYTRPRVNKNIYEAWIYCLRMFSKSDRDVLVKNRGLVVNLFSELLEVKQFSWAVNSRKPETMRYRNSEILKLIKRIVEIDR